MTDLELGYIAGIIDGEGCIGIYKYQVKNSIYHKLIVQVNMRCENLLNKIKDLTNVGFICNCRKGSRFGKPYFQWAITGNNAKNLLEHILPLLIEKKEQARLAIEFQNMAIRSVSASKEKISNESYKLREEYRTKISALKHIGAGNGC